jgi:hypothetical protein
LTHQLFYLSGLVIIIALGILFWAYCWTHGVMWSYHSCNVFYNDPKLFTTLFTLAGTALSAIMFLLFKRILLITVRQTMMQPGATVGHVECKHEQHQALWNPTDLL